MNSLTQTTRTQIFVGECPTEEECAQVGADNYRTQSILEITTFIRQIRRQFGVEPPNSALRRTSNLHDFGTYYELEYFYDQEDPHHQEYAHILDANTPTHWDQQSCTDLNLPYTPARRAATKKLINELKQYTNQLTTLTAQPT